MVAQMFNYKDWFKLIDNNEIKKIIPNMLKESGFSVLNMCEHYFKPDGYTVLWLLGESHLAIHTFPEESKMYLELSSCVERPFKIFVTKIEQLDLKLDNISQN